MFKQLSARGWGTVEPVPIRREQPHLWREVIEVHRQERGYSDTDLAALARVDLATLADLFPENFNSPHTPLRLVQPAVS